METAFLVDFDISVFLFYRSVLSPLGGMETSQLIHSHAPFIAVLSPLGGMETLKC